MHSSGAARQTRRVLQETRLVCVCVMHIMKELHIIRELWFFLAFCRHKSSAFKKSTRFFFLYLCNLVLFLTHLLSQLLQYLHIIFLCLCYVEIFTVSFLLFLLLVPVRLCLFFSYAFMRFLLCYHGQHLLFHPHPPLCERAVPMHAPV